MKDFLEKALKIEEDLRGYGSAFRYAALYEGHKTIVIQGEALLERVEEIIPELREMVAYMKAKDTKKREKTNE